MKSPPAIALAGTVALIVAMGIGRFAFTPILPLILEEGTLSLADAGMLASANYIGYLLGAVGATFILIKPERAIPFGLLIIGMVTVAMAWHLPYSAWLLLRCIAGIASAWVLVSVSAWSLNVLTQYKRPFLSGLVFAGVGIGIALAGLICLLIVAVHRSAATAWLSMGGLAFALTALTWRSFCNATKTTDIELTYKPPFKWNAQSIWMTVIYGLFGFGYIIPATFLPVMARNALPDPALSAWSWPLFGTIAAISVLVVGRLAQRLGNLRLWAVSQIMLAIGVALPALFGGLLPVMLAALCVGGTFMIITLSAIQEAKVIAQHNSSVLIAAMTSAFALGQILGPLAVPFFSKGLGDFTFILLTSAVLTLASALILLTIAGDSYNNQTIKESTKGIHS